MSVWSKVKGSYYTKIGNKFSLRKGIKQYLGDELVGLQISQQDRGSDVIWVTFKTDFCADGIDAAKRVENLIKAIQQSGVNGTIDFTATIRYRG